MSSVQQQQPVISVAQRFPGVGQVPMEIRMVPGMPSHSPMMSAQRIGMVPVRMGMPMQIRPGFARFVFSVCHVSGCQPSRMICAEYRTQHVPHADTGIRILRPGV